jgi:transcriptional regulator with XRE-family HTH domain
MPTPSERLALLLEVHDDSLRSAADRCGLDHTTLMRVRNGETENPATLQRIASAYGVTVTWLRGERDLAVDFSFEVLLRPLQERVMFLWEHDRRIAYALDFLRRYAPEKYTVEHLAATMTLPSADLQGMITRGHGAVSAKQLERLSTETGLPMEWFRTGMIGCEDQDEILVGLAELVLSHLAESEGVEVTPDEIHEAALALI